MHRKYLRRAHFIGPRRISFRVCVIVPGIDGELAHEQRFKMRVLGHTTVADFRADINAFWEDRGHPLREIAATSEDILGFVSLETNETLMAEVLERAHYLITIVAAA